MKKKLLNSMRALLVAAGLCAGATSAWAETTTVGNADNTTSWWSAFSDYYTIEPNQTLTVSFKNYSDKSENWMNYIGVLTTDADRDASGYSEYVVMRADCYGWQGSLNTNNDQTWFTSNTNNFDWTTFKDDMDGASVVMTVKREGAKVTMKFDITTTGSKSYQHEFVMNCGDGTQNIRAFLTTQNGHLTDITSSVQTNVLSYTGTVDFVAKNRCSYSNGTFTTNSDAGNQYALAVADLSGLENFESASTVTLDFDVTVNGRLLIGIGDKNIRGTTANGSNKTSYNTDGLIMRYGTSDGNYVRVNGGSNNSNLKGTSSHVKFTLDRTTGKYSYTITYVDGNSVTQTGLSGSNISTSVSNATIIEAYSWSGNQSNALSSVSYSYTYNPTAYDYSVKAVTAEGTELKTFSEGSKTEAATIAYPYAIKVGDDWYVTTATTYVTTVSSVNPTAEIVYEKDEQIVGFFEGESTAGEQANYSNGGYGTVAAQNARNRGTFAGTLPPGKYQFIARLVADGNSGRAITIREGTNDPMASATGSNTTKTVTDDFTIYATTGNLYINGANVGDAKTNLSTSFDYVVIKRVGDATISGTIASGYSSLASAYGLDFANATGLTAAYVVTKITKDAVTLSPVDEVPAGTGVILKGSGAYSIPVKADASFSGTNLLNAAVEAYDCAANEVYILQGGEFHLVTAASTVPAGKAYLSADDVPVNARSLIFEFGDEATGISAVSQEVLSGEFYNLQGQRVDAPKKGLYIVNGKKVIIK